MRVIVGIDESEESFHALQWSLDNLFDHHHLITGTGTSDNAAKENDHNNLVALLHVQQPFHHYAVPAGPGGSAFYIPSSVEESVRKAQEQISKALLSRASQMCKDKMIKVKSLIIDGDPKEKICQATEQMQADLLIVGNRNLGKIRRAFLGSVSDYCAHHASCPILIVKSPKSQ